MGLGSGLLLCGGPVVGGGFGDLRCRGVGDGCGRGVLAARVGLGRSRTRSSPVGLGCGCVPERAVVAADPTGTDSCSALAPLAAPAGGADSGATLVVPSTPGLVAVVFGPLVRPTTPTNTSRAAAPAAAAVDAGWRTIQGLARWRGRGRTRRGLLTIVASRPAADPEKARFRRRSPAHWWAADRHDGCWGESSSRPGFAVHTPDVYGPPMLPPSFRPCVDKTLSSRLRLWARRMSSQLSGEFWPVRSWLDLGRPTRSGRPGRRGPARPRHGDKGPKPLLPGGGRG